MLTDTAMPICPKKLFHAVTHSPIDCNVVFDFLSILKSSVLAQLFFRPCYRNCVCVCVCVCERGCVCVGVVVCATFNPTYCDMFVTYTDIIINSDSIKVTHTAMLL